MRTTKLAIAVFLLCAICLSLCACSISKSDVVGTWVGTWTYNGNNISSSFVLSSDGTYSKVTLRNGNLSSSESGTYAIEGSDVLLYENGKTNERTRYEYKSGKLYNGGHEFTKK